MEAVLILSLRHLLGPGLRLHLACRRHRMVVTQLLDLVQLVRFLRPALMAVSSLIKPNSNVTLITLLQRRIAMISKTNQSLLQAARARAELRPVQL